MRKPYPTDLSDAEWKCIESLTCLLQVLPGGPEGTPYARSLTPSSTWSKVAVLGACCRMSFRLGKRSTTTSGLGASTVLGSSCTLPCAIGYEYVSRGTLNRVRA